MIALSSTDLEQMGKAIGVYTSGEYKCHGFIIRSGETISCVGAGWSPYKEKTETFCKNIENGTYKNTSGSWANYTLP